MRRWGVVLGGVFFCMIQSCGLLYNPIRPVSEGYLDTSVYVDVPEGLYSYWRINTKKRENGEVTDLMGHHDLIETGGVYTEWHDDFSYTDQDYIIAAGGFDSDDYLSCCDGSDSSPYDKQDFAVEAWVDTSSMPWETQYIVSKADLAASSGWGVGINDYGEMTVRLADQEFHSVNVIKIDQWNYLVWIKKGDKLRFYCNMVKETVNVPGSFPLSDAALRIGSVRSGPVNWFDGYVGEIAYWKGLPKWADIEATLKRRYNDYHDGGSARPYFR